jgi:hypothetical protein
VPGIVTEQSVGRAMAIVAAALQGGPDEGSTTLKRLHEDASREGIAWVAFEEVKYRLNLLTIRTRSGQLAWACPVDGVGNRTLHLTPAPAKFV